jgi:hypothetical protein
MTQDELKKRLQGHFTDGLVTIVGSGLSCAEGIPGMKSLADHLNAEVPRHLDATRRAQWEPISQLLTAGKDLESAMLDHAPTPDVESVIVSLTSRFIAQHEATVFQEVFSGTRDMRLTRLFKHLLKPSTGIPIITTNYERLVEIAAEMAGLGVDTQFVGHSYARMNARECRMSFCRDTQTINRNVHLRYADRVVLSKPHGSLDWYQHNGEPMRCPYDLDLPRLLITPGRNKFRTGYDRPFDSHRERANRDIDRASRFLILGYGFNDDHLETHLAPRIRDGTPTLVLTHTLSLNGTSLLTESPSMTVITCDPKTAPGAIVHTKDGTTAFNGGNIWDLGQFISEVLEP